MAYMNAGHRAAATVESGVHAAAGLVAINMANAVSAARDRIDAQRLRDHAALAAERGEAVRMRAAHTIELLARERRNADELAESLAAARLEAAMVVDLEDTIARLRRELRMARGN